MDDKIYEQPRMLMSIFLTEKYVFSILLSMSYRVHKQTYVALLNPQLAVSYPILLPGAVQLKQLKHSNSKLKQRKYRLFELTSISYWH